MNGTDFLNQSSAIVPIESLSLLDPIKEPFSENEILALQEKFLRNGFQYIKVQDCKAGRSIVQRFLDSLAVYHDIACISLSDNPLPKYITDIYYELANCGYLDPFGQHYLDDYFIEHFYFDFIWIEATQKLFSSTWFQDFEDKILSFKIDEHIPFIIVSYEKE
jgi:hypothetical protein